MVLSKKNSAKEKISGEKKYFRGLGRRKLAIAGVKIFLSSKNSAETNIMIKGRSYTEYFRLPELQDMVAAPIKSLAIKNLERIDTAVRGGGIKGQAEAVRLAISRALVKIDEVNRKPLRDLGFLTRDARAVERKKAGLKKARRAPQFSKR